MVRSPVVKFLPFAAVPIAWLLFVLFFDVGTVDDSDLALPERVIDPAQNPFPELRNLQLSEGELEELSRVSKMMLGSEPIDSDFLLAMTEKQSPRLDEFDRYAAMTAWKADGAIAIDSVDVRYGIHWSTLASLKQVEAAHHAAMGRSDEALASAIAIMRFGSGIQSAGSPMTGWITGGNIRLGGQRCLLSLMEQRVLRQVDLDHLAETLEEPSLASLHFESMVRAEYVYNKQLFLLLRAGSGSNRWTKLAVYKQNRTSESLAEAHREAIRLSGTLAVEAESSLGSKGDPNWWRDLPHRVGGNWWGYSSMIGVYDILSSGLRSFFVFRAHHELLRTRVALERHRIEHGAWPERLAELVPDFLNEVPVDPIDGNPLRYDPTRRLIYSLGEDLIDNGGVAPDRPGSLRSRAEIVIELEPANPAPWPEFPLRS